MRLISLLTQSVTVQSELKRDFRGNVDLSGQRTIRARVQLQSRVLKNSQGKEDVTTHRIFTDQEIKLTDRVWLPGADVSKSGASKPVIAVASHPHPTQKLTLYEVDV